MANILKIKSINAHSQPKNKKQFFQSNSYNNEQTSANQRAKRSNQPPIYPPVCCCLTIRKPGSNHLTGISTIQKLVCPTSHTPYTSNQPPVWPAGNKGPTTCHTMQKPVCPSSDTPCLTPPWQLQLVTKQPNTICHLSDQPPTNHLSVLLANHLSGQQQTTCLPPVWPPPTQPPVWPDGLAHN